ncbi:nucleoside/nucleotide kinase family protein [Brevibacterium siliguriense]|uniref:uridine kinase n=1 Tax=Brevibacterium siliguriense TaxID=1136497 RepID=UPI001E4D38F7|nr:uridine kinase [Brevibacterium siliguriense]
MALDGVDGAGKTTIARELVDLAEENAGNSWTAPARPVASVGIDGFHHPRAVRHADGTGPETFYRSSYDYNAFLESVVGPFRRGEAIIPSSWDVDADLPVESQPRILPSDCVLLVEGIFLHRPELVDLWDASVWIEVPFEVSVPRGNERFPGRFDADPEDRSNRRYVGGQRLYFAEASPCEKATWVLDNRDLERPALVHRI